MGFDPYVQDSFKILPLATKTRFAGNMDLRTAKGYTRWKELNYLPDSVRQFSNELDIQIKKEYPIMFNSDIIADKNNESSKIHLEMIDKIKSNDILYESLLWYADHTYLIPENKRFEQIYDKFKLKERFTGSGPDSMFLGYFNPLGFNFDEMIELFENKDEESKAVTELTSLQ